MHGVRTRMSRTRAYPPDWMTADEAAYMLMISPSTFRDYVARKILPDGVLIAGSRRWSRARLNEVLEQRLEQPLNAPGDDEIADAIKGWGHGKKANAQRGIA